jgi:hypothetical protein
MLGRKDYTQEEYDNARAAVAKQLATYKKIAKLAAGADARHGQSDLTRNGPGRMNREP